MRSMFLSWEVTEGLEWAGGGGEGCGEREAGEDAELGRRRSVGWPGEVSPVEGSGAEVVTIVVLVSPGSE